MDPVLAAAIVAAFAAITGSVLTLRATSVADVPSLRHPLRADVGLPSRRTAVAGRGW